MNPGLVATVVMLYVLCLVLIAKYFANRPRPANWFESLTYALSIGAYCTAWTYFGSVEKASYEGFSFLAVYVGSIIGSFFWRSIWRKLIRIKDRYSVTSLADLLALRHGKSQFVATGVTLFLVVGMVPYISLQMKALLRSTNFLLLMPMDQVPTIEAWGIVALLLFLTIFFGLRKLNSTERHPSLVFTSAFESVVKLFSFLIIGATVVYLGYGGFGTLFAQVEEMRQTQQLQFPMNKFPVSSWISVTVMSLFAFLFLPRQFHMAVVEATHDKHLSRASWLFPLFLVLINLFVLPVALIGLLQGHSHRDLFLLEIPREMGLNWAVMLGYLGGLSAVFGMVIVEVTTLSTMVSSNIILPLARRLEGLSFLSQKVLYLRWISAALILTASLLYLQKVGDRYALASIGMISFAAIFQLVPSVLGGLYWRNGSYGGMVFSLLTGALIWLLTLFIPALAKSGLIAADFLQTGYFEISFFHPEALFGVKGFDPLTHTFIWSLIFGPASYIIGSILLPQKKSESIVANDIVNISSGEKASDFLPEAPQTVELAGKRRMMIGLLQKYFSPHQANVMVDEILTKVGLLERTFISVPEISRIVSKLEASLAGAIGAAQAHVEIKRLGIFTEQEKRDLENCYSELLANLNVSPADLMRRASLEQQRNELLSAEAERLQVQLVQKSRLSALGEMASGMAHEINNPLTIIRLNLQMLKQRAPAQGADAEKNIPIFDKVITATDRINRIISSLAAFAKQSDDGPMLPTPLRTMVEHGLQFCRARYSSRDVPIFVEDIPEIDLSCRSNEIEQVLFQLLNNAYDAIENLPEKWIRMSFKVEGGVLVIRIVDSGTGIHGEVAEKLMQPFYTTKPQGTGTGLGLSVSKGIVEQHGGKLYLARNTNHTTFVIELPLKPSN